MNILITMDSKGILKNIEPKDITDFIQNEWSEEDKGSLIESKKFTSEELLEKLEIQLENEGKEIDKFIVDNLSPDSLLKSIDDNHIEDYVSNYTEFYISDDIPELMEQIHSNGTMDEVIELLSIQYTR